ncbi:MAG: dihydrofolate reductase family protein [Bdellovibrionaceae bacterium]|nr:dihydrofolate reductase family protein [Pseudobdellovibrionaceae bacterium]
MAKLVSSINVSWGGHCGHEAGIHDADMHAVMMESVRNAGSILLGRKTFELFEAFWPKAARNPKATPDLRAMGQALSLASKVVISSTRQRSEWSHTTFVDGQPDFATAIQKLKADTPKMLLLFGSVALHEKLSELNLVDEYEFVLQPMAIPGGPKLFENLRERRDLALVSMKSLASGVVILRYRPVAPRSPT